MKTATFVRVLYDAPDRRQELFRVEPAAAYLRAGEELHTAHVIASSVDGIFGCETYLFPADADGECLDLIELDGSQRDTRDIDAVLADAGYAVVRDEAAS